MQQYEDLIERADRNFDSQDFVRAKALYEQASEVMPDEVYPRTRAVESGERIVELGADDKEEVTSNSDEEGDALDREYEDQIRLGDEAFDAEDWTSAQAGLHRRFGTPSGRTVPQKQIAPSGFFASRTLMKVKTLI